MPERFSFPTIAAALDAASSSGHGVRFHDGRGRIVQELSYSALREAALAIAARLSAAGLRKGDSVAVAAETCPEFIAVFYGCQYAGVIPCPLPCRTNLGSLETYSEKIATMLKAGQVRAMIALPQQDGLEAATAESGIPLISYEDILVQAPGPLPPPPVPEDIAYIQFSSGSTSHPKGILITQRAVSANVAAILAHGLHLVPEDRAFSWLPFYHDMGLVGFSIAPVYGRCSVDYLPALAFARRPVLWLRLMAAYGSTITYSPSFGYKLAALRYASEPEAFDLSRLRIAGIGGDMIRADVLDQFAEALRETGFTKQAFLPSYGMAEATLAISFGATDEPFEVDHIGGNGMEEAGNADVAETEHARTFVSCGYPLPNVDVRITDDDGEPLADYRTGRIRIRGPNLMSGYAGDPQRVPATLDTHGFFDTGDLGYLRRGQLVVTGRAKDLILFRGRNIWPEDVEWAAEKAASLNHGDTAAFSIDNPAGDDTIILLVQTRRRNAEELSAMRDAVHRTISQTLGVSCEIVFVDPGSLPKTSSGKLARSRARTLFIDGAFKR